MSHVVIWRKNVLDRANREHKYPKESTCPAFSEERKGSRCQGQGKNGGEMSQVTWELILQNLLGFATTLTFTLNQMGSHSGKYHDLT